jgi:DNA-binding transcriptional ArsR family regulator
VATIDRTFIALTDSTRRLVLKKLAQKGAQSIADLHKVNKNISRQAFEKHITVLSKAKLISKSKQGREAIIKLHPSPLMDVSLWVQQYEKLWDSKLKDLGQYLDKKL